jgi:long-chain acyl-CoA synthetase
MSAQRFPVEVLLDRAQENPDEPWLVQPVKGEPTVYTWSAAAEQVGRMAAALDDMGLEPGSRIGISGVNTAHWLMADLAIALAGHVSVGLYPKQSPEHISYIVEHSETKAMFVGPMPDADEFMSALPDGVKTIGFPYAGVPSCDARWDELAERHAPITDYSRPEPDALMTLVYTSGSTGKPKGVMLTFGNIAFAISGFVEALPPGDEERLFSYLPLAHIFERIAVGLVSLSYRAELHFLESQDKLADQLAEVQPTRFFGVPLVFGRVQKGILQKVGQEKLERATSIPGLRTVVRRKVLQGVGLQHVRTCISGSAPLPLPLLEWFEKNVGLEVLQGYGMTECCAYATCNLPRQNKMGTVGRALPGVELKLSEEGELLLKHGAVMKGYYKDEDKTRETFTDDGFLRTGDKAEIDEDGYVSITGRVKDIFKTLKGKYIAPAPIEGAMARNDSIDHLVLVGSGLNQPIMLLTLTANARERPREDVEKALVSDMKSVNSKLEAHEKIAKLIVVKDDWTIDNGMLTPTMKVRSSEVEDRYAELIAQEAEDREAEIAWE